MSSETSHRPRLSRSAVLAEALALLDAEGLEALTMRNLSDRLGVVPMALYRHVKNKEDLLDGVLDLATALVEIPADGLGWRDGLTELARSIRSTMLDHPALAGAVIGRPSLGPHALAIGEYGFSMMRSGGFADADVEHGLNLLFTYTLGFVALEVPRTVNPDVAMEVLDTIYEQVPAESLPHTAALRPTGAAFISEAQFEFGLRTILDGLAQLLPGKRRRS